MTTAPNDSNDPRPPGGVTEETLTAFVLGELSPDDVATVERALEGSPAIRAEIDAIRRTTDELAAAFRAEPAPGLHAAQRRAVVNGPAAASNEADERSPVLFSFRTALWTGAGLAVAACLAFAAFGPMILDRSGPGVAIGERGARNAEMDNRVLRDREPARSNEHDAVRRRAGERDDASGTKQVAAELSSVGDALAGPEGARAEAQTIDANAFWAKTGRGAGAVGATEQLMAAPTRVSPASPAAPPAARGVTRSAARPVAAGQRLRKGDAVTATAADDRDERVDGEAYAELADNTFRDAITDPLSTFSIDVDTASYSNVRRMLEAGILPPRDAVRIEEMINYFDYAYEPPSGDQPFSVNVEVNTCPWNATNRLVRIGLQGAIVDADMRPATSLVFLIDVSGSMNAANKLPLLKQSLHLLVDRLTADDRVAIVVYANAEGLVLDSTYCNDKQQVHEAIERLHAGGSTAGGAGIELAYEVAQRHFIRGGVNRVLLCTDGDFNVGLSRKEDLDRLIERKRDSGVFLSVLGFGDGNWQDDRMESLSNKGNGNFAYIDKLEEAQRVLVDRLGGTLVTIAKDVKIQVEFNPAQVGAYRLIGYVNRVLAARDFDDDRKDAGEIGAGHTVTALYEIVPTRQMLASRAAADDGRTPAAAGGGGAGSGGSGGSGVGAGGRVLRYQRQELVESPELLHVKLRFKQPDGDVSTKIERPIFDGGALPSDASHDFRFAAGVAAFGMLLRDSQDKGDVTYERVLDLATVAAGDDPARREFLRLVEQARSLAAARGGGEVREMPRP